jgi:hypothetical protein
MRRGCRLEKKGYGRKEKEGEVRRVKGGEKMEKEKKDAD